MVGSSSPRDPERELADLRARAYGPDPDIQDDPKALARLVELEAQRAREGTGLSAAEAGDGVDAAATGVEEASAPDSAPQAEPEPATSPRESASPSRRLRMTFARSGRIWLAAGAAVAVVAVASLVVRLVGPHPDATLRPTARAVDDHILQFIGGIRDHVGDIDTTTLASYEEFRGVEPWFAVDRHGNPCLIVIEPSTRALFDAECTPREADLIADIEAWPVLDERFAEGLPDGTVIRFHFRGDSVEAWVHRPPTDE